MEIKVNFDGVYHSSLDFREFAGTAVIRQKEGSRSGYAMNISSNTLYDKMGNNVDPSKLRYFVGDNSKKKITISGFKKMSVVHSGLSLIPMYNQTTCKTEYIEFEGDVYSISDRAILFKYNNEWYLISKLFYKSPKDVKELIAIDGSKPFMITGNNYSAYHIYGSDKAYTDKKAEVTYDCVKKTILKNNSVIHKLSSLPKDLIKYNNSGHVFPDITVREVLNWYVYNGTGFTHKSSDGVSSTNVLPVLTKKELLAQPLHESPQYLYRRKMLALFGWDNPYATLNYRFKSGGSDTNGKPILGTIGSSCMDFVKKPHDILYYIQKGQCDLFSQTEEDVFNWYETIMTLFEGLYTKEDIKISLIECSQQSFVVSSLFGLNPFHYEVKLSSNVKSFHKYLFAILFRYLYCSDQCTFVDNLKKIMKKDGVGLWDALKQFHKKQTRTNSWDIVYEEALNSNLSLERYLELLAEYKTENGPNNGYRFTQLITLK